MAKTGNESDLLNQMETLEKQIEAFRSQKGEQDRLVSETLAYMRAEINIAKNRLSEIPQKAWVKKTRHGETFIPLLLQTHRMISDSIAILSRSRPAFKKEPYLHDTACDEDVRELISRLREDPS